jgi:hypothetical protein
VYSLTWRESLTGQQPVLPTSITSLTWRERCTTGQQDPMQSSIAWSKQLMGKTDMGFPTGSTMAGHFYFPIRQHRIDSRSSFQGCVTNNPRRVNIGSNYSDRGCIGYLRSQPKIFHLSGTHQGILLQRFDRSPSDHQVEWRRIPLMAPLGRFICMHQG